MDSNSLINKKSRNIKESITLAISSKANEMKASGLDVISFSVGQPDFPTSMNIKEAAIESINKNFTNYTNASGIIKLKEAVVDKFKKDNNILYTTNNIIISNGAKHSLHNTFQVLLEEGDEVIIPKPYWVSYPEQVKISGGTPIFCETDEKNKIKASLIEEQLTNKTKIIILCTPSNPTGMVCNKEELEKIASIAIKNNIFVISDEVYEYFVYNAPHISIASLNDEIKKLTITINAVSKSYSMTGWRIGYCGCDKKIAKAMSRLQSQTTSNPCSISQMAALEAINGSKDCVEEMKQEFDKRRKIMVELLNGINGIKCEVPQGAFYCFADISDTGMKSMEFCNKLLEEVQVAVVPGLAFGDDKYIRLSYACSEENIRKGLARIKSWASSITN